jgi:hypothetical protein
MSDARILTVGKVDRAIREIPEAEELAARLWANVQQDGECWLWQGTKRNGQHGSMSVHDAPVYVHRISYEVHVGPIPKGLNVCHRCDRPACVNPDHLFLGTQADNVADMETKGRARKRGATGERNPNARLTDAEVLELRRLAASGASQRSVARRFSCTQATVWRIIHGKTRSVARDVLFPRGLR